MAIAPDALAAAVEHFRAGRFEEALAITERHEIENALGTEAAKRGDLDEAERHYRRAIACSPGFFKPHNNLGNVLLGRGQWSAAVEHYRAALAIEPSALRVHGNLGNTLFELGLLADAVASYERALALGAGAPVALRLGEALEAIGDTDQALLAYARAAELGEPKAVARREQLVAAIQQHGPFGRPAPLEPPAPSPTASGDRLGRRRLVESAGDELGALLSPVSPATFVDEVWGKRPLFVKGFAEKYRGFFDWSTFIEAIGKPGDARADTLRASFDKRVPAPKPSPRGAPEIGTRAFTITPRQSEALFEAGATICLTEVDARVPRLGAFVAAVKRQLGYPGKVALNAYGSPAGAGFNWHFDGRIASTLQIAGTKRWRFSHRVAIDWPRGNGARKTDGSAVYSDPGIARAPWERLAPLDENEITTVILEPGDLLILPAGLWHDACGGPTGSLALNLCFLPASLTSLVDELLDGLLDSDPAWRSAAPLLPSPEGAVDPARLEAVQRQLEKAADALRSLAADRSALARAWASFVAGEHGEPGE